MTTINVALLFALGNERMPVMDVSAGPASAQLIAQPMLWRAVRVKEAVANGSLVLKSILSEEAPNYCFVINDSGQTIKVYCAAGENLNGSANASLSIPTGESAIFIPVPNEAGGTTDWRAAAIA